MTASVTLPCYSCANNRLQALSADSTRGRWGRSAPTKAVIPTGLNAQFKGTGTINGTGSYGFMIWAPGDFRERGGGIDNS